ncbi:unnamed protein product [Amoebophrya sp. A25]|nr:unnamed protein product [Amoebophrya sp. A25]|eukprot:GSA25T00010353001.1
MVSAKISPLPYFSAYELPPRAHARSLVACHHATRDKRQGMPRNAWTPKATAAPGSGLLSGERPHRRGPAPDTYQSGPGP